MVCLVSGLLCPPSFSQFLHHHVLNVTLALREIDPEM